MRAKQIAEVIFRPLLKVVNLRRPILFLEDGQQRLPAGAGNDQRSYQILTMRQKFVNILHTGRLESGKWMKMHRLLMETAEIHPDYQSVNRVPARS